MKKSPRINHRYYSDYVGSSLEGSGTVSFLAFLPEEEAWGPHLEWAWGSRWAQVFAMAVVCTSIDVTCDLSSPCALCRGRGVSSFCGDALDLWICVYA